jgi:hypothetical protein
MDLLGRPAALCCSMTVPAADPSPDASSSAWNKLTALSFGTFLAVQLNWLLRVLLGTRRRSRGYPLRAAMMSTRCLAKSRGRRRR